MLNLMDEFVSTIDACRIHYQKLITRGFNPETYAEFYRLLDKGKKLNDRLDRSKYYAPRRRELEPYFKELLEMDAVKDNLVRRDKSKEPKNSKKDEAEEIDLQPIGVKGGEAKLFSIIPRTGEIGNVLSQLKVYNPRKVIAGTSYDQLGNKIETHHFIISASESEALALAFLRGVSEIRSTNVRFIQYSNGSQIKEVEEVRGKSKKRYRSKTAI